MGYQICVYAMCKNEEPFVERWIHSMKEADRIVVMDTGSTDNTVAALRASGADVYTEPVIPWRWDTARERSLSYVPGDVDICVATDLDDVWTAGWRALLEKAWIPGTTRARHLYNYAISPDGRPLNQNFKHSRIHARHGYKWVRANHEYLQYIGEGEEKIIDVEGLTLNHYPDTTKSRSFNLALSKLALQEDPDDVDMLRSLGLDYYNNNMFAKVKETFLQYLKHPKADDAELRCQAMYLIAKCFELDGDSSEAYRWFFRAIAEDHQHKDAFMELALAAYRKMDWHTALFGACKVLEISDVSSHSNHSAACGPVPYHIASLACCALGLLPQALTFAKQAQALDPGDEQFSQNVKNLETLLEAV